MIWVEVILTQIPKLRSRAVEYIDLVIQKIKIVVKLMYFLKNLFSSLVFGVSLLFFCFHAFSCFENIYDLTIDDFESKTEVMFFTWGQMRNTVIEIERRKQKS